MNNKQYKYFFTKRYFDAWERTIGLSILTFAAIVVLVATANVYAQASAELSSTGGTQVEITAADSTNLFLGRASDSVARPSFSWRGDTNTGIYHPRRATIGFVTGGTEWATINELGTLELTSKSNSVPQLTLARNHNQYTDFFANENGDLVIIPLNSSKYGNILLNGLGGRVGIGDFSPTALLTVGSGDLFQVNDSGDVSTVGTAKVEKSLTVGKTATPKGITLFDEVTGAPYCVKVKSGKLSLTNGACQ